MNNLTSMFDEQSERGFRDTPPGMAHWTGTGPDNTTCRECAHFGREGRYIADSPKHAKGELKPAHCNKYWQLMRGKGPKIKPSLASCKHFEAREGPEPLYKQHG